MVFVKEYDGYSFGTAEFVPDGTGKKIAAKALWDVARWLHFRTTNRYCDTLAKEKRAIFNRARRQPSRKPTAGASS